MNFLYFSTSWKDLRSDDVFQTLGNELNQDADFVWKRVFQEPCIMTCSATMEKQLRCSFLLDTLEFPTITMASRLRDMLFCQYSRSPQVLASYLGTESLETTYVILDNEAKRDLLRAAIHQWGICSNVTIHQWGILSEKMKVESEEWDNTMRGLFALGARFELLGSGEEDSERPEEVKGGIIGPYVWSRWMDSLHVFRDIVDNFIHGFEIFISKTKCLGIELEASPTCRRFEFCLDSDFIWSTDTFCNDEWYWEPHRFSLYYDDDLSTWVMWDSMYEAYCGEFWDMIDHPEIMMPGT